MSEIVPVPFHNEDVWCVVVDGKPHVIVKPAVDALGLDYWSQIEKLRKRSWAALGSSQVQLPGQQQRREMITCDVRTFRMLLATIDENRVAADVQPRLVEYQREVADTIEAYFSDGGAINPRASQDQLVALAGVAERRIAMLRAADGLVDSKWLEARTRHEIARGLGEEPEVEWANTPITVGEYLEEKGIRGAAQRSMASMFGKRVKKAYRDTYGKDPEPTPRFIDGAIRPVAAYTNAHRHLFDAVWTQINGEAS